jgi:hypothetical protein
MHPVAIVVPFMRWMLLGCALAASASGQLVVEWDRNPGADTAGYMVYLGTASAVYTTIVDVGDTTSHTFSGLAAGTVYFCRLQAYGADGLVSEATPETMFTLQSSGAPGFSAWAAAGGLTGAEALPGATPHRDGVTNLLKFAFNLNPAGPDVRMLTKGTGTAGLPVFAMQTGGGQAAFTVEFLRRRSGGLVYTPQAGSDLMGFAPMAGTPVVSVINTEWERVVVEMPLASSVPVRMFGRVAVEMP